MRGWLIRSRVRWTPASLDELQALVGKLSLHPEDRSTVNMKIGMARYYGADSGCRSELIGLIDGLCQRYSHPFDSGHHDAVDEIRILLPPPQRGRAVRGMFGEFRRGQAVCRIQGERRGKSIIEDAIFLEAEPSSDHARRFGRMVGVQTLDDLSLTRWFLDELHHGREYGRPW